MIGGLHQHMFYVTMPPLNRGVTGRGACHHGDSKLPPPRFRLRDVMRENFYL